MSQVHDFREQLKYSEECSDEPFWSAVYEKAFPNLVSTSKNDNKNVAQFLGIDRVLFLSSGKTLYVDEKKRRKDYPDIVLEYVSNDQTNTPGWIEKDIPIDFLAYAFMPTRRCFLFQWNLLQKAWKERGQKWRRWAKNREHGFSIVEAKNHTYTTWSIAVPIKSLLAATNCARIIDV